MSKQDRQGSRTPAQLEQEYKFGRKFAEAMGLADDAADAAKDAKDAVDALDKKLTQDELFDRLTKNGKVEGIYRDWRGNVFINASYMVSGILRSADGSTFYLDLDNGVLKGKFEELSISGKSVVTGDALDKYAQSVTESLENLQQQIDGQIQSWFYDYVPTTSNYPASEWTTETMKIEHLGDLFYIVDNEESGGLTYRWSMVGDNYQWVLVEDSGVAKALAQAAQAQDTADGKRRVFVIQPTPPYDIGDLWTDGADLKVCKTARVSGSYYASDWKLATDYIDSDTAADIAQGKVDDQTQADIFNKLTNNGALKGIYMQNGQLYINASYLMSGYINASLLKTGIITSNDGSVQLDLSNNSVTIKGPDGNSIELSAGNILAKDNSGNTRIRIGKIVGSHYLLSLITNSGSTISFTIWDDRITFSAPSYGGSNNESYELAWKDNGNGTRSMIGIPSTQMEETEHTVKLDLGNAGATTSNWQTLSFPHNISGIKEITRCEGYISGSKATTLPAINGGMVMVWADKTNVYLYRESAYTPPSDERLYVQLWYTK